MENLRNERNKYLDELKSWLKDTENAAAEEMGDFFTSRIDTYEEHMSRWSKEYELMAELLPSETKTLLDIGCGTGLELDQIFKRFPDLSVTGVDLCATMLEKLKGKHGGRNLELVCADYFVFPFEEKRFDAAVSFETLHHFPYGKKGGIYTKLYRALEDGGCYIECDYMARCEEEERICLENWETRRRNSGVADDAFVHIDIPLTVGHQIELMTSAGFGPVSVLHSHEGTVIIRADKCKKGDDES